MEGKQSEYDFLDLSKNYTIKNNITRDEEIQFSDKIYKINKHNWKQERNIIITDKAIYNLKKLSLKRRIDFKTIIGITVSSYSDEIVIHCNDIDYDYHYISQRKKMIIEIIAKFYQIINEEELKLFILCVKNLNTFVTTKKEKQKQKNTTRMPNKNATSVADYLFGKNDNKNTTFRGLPSKSFKNVPVQYEDFEVIKVIGRGSVGKILLVKYTKDQQYYVMKSMRKDQLISEGLKDNVLIERNILMEGACEFILSLSFYFQTPQRIYYICPFIKGGDLFHKLKIDGFLKEDLARFYAAQVAVALQHLHDSGIAYRDLKPENILIDEDGYIKLCDFGASVEIRGTEKETNFGGSPEYASPEMVTFEGHTFMTDWWSFGILLYEMLYGFTPFYNIDKNRMFDLITAGSISYPKSINITINGEAKEKTYKVSDDAKSLINKLLVKDPGMRLGRKGLDEIKKHSFFSGINFEDLKKKKVKAHFKPTIDNNDITNNFDEEYLNMEISESPIADWSKEAEFSNLFASFDKVGEEEGFEVLDPVEMYTEPRKTVAGDDDDDD
jgi:serine/threonine protein kinase